MFRLTRKPKISRLPNAWHMLNGKLLRGDSIFIRDPWLTVQREMLGKAVNRGQISKECAASSVHAFVQRRDGALCCAVVTQDGSEAVLLTTIPSGQWGFRK